MPSSTDIEERERLQQVLRGAGYSVVPDSPGPVAELWPLVTASGRPVSAKCYPAGKGEAAFTNMQKLWGSSFGHHRRPAGLPQPLDFVPEAGALIMERVEGQSLARAGRPAEEVIVETIRLLAALHECDAQPET